MSIHFWWTDSHSTELRNLSKVHMNHLENSERKNILMLSKVCIYKDVWIIMLWRQIYQRQSNYSGMGWTNLILKMFGVICLLIADEKIKIWLVWFGFMVLNATFNNISVISWWSVLLVEEIGENHRPVTSHWQTLSYNVVSSTTAQQKYEILKDDRCC